MVKDKTTIKLLRRLGITLIALPEPVTTPFGVALLLTSHYLSKRLETRQNDRLRETIGHYLAHTGWFGADADSQPGPAGPVTRYALRQEQAILGQITGSAEANLAPSVWQSWQDMRHRAARYAADMQTSFGHYGSRSSLKAESGWPDGSGKAEKTAPHAINMRELSQRYEGGGSAVAHSGRVHTSGAGETVTQHSLNMILLSQAAGVGSVSQAKVSRHTINKALLPQHHAPAGCVAVRSALRSNNYYYDLVSQKNVIGGYPCLVPRFADPSADSSGKNKTAKGKRENPPRSHYALAAT